MNQGVIPRQGDIIIASFDPQSGHEQRGRRPALVLSKHLFNFKLGLCLACPITNTDRSIRLHIALPESMKTTGFIMTEQIKSIDFKSRKARIIESVPSHILEEALAMIHSFIDFNYEG